MLSSRLAWLNTCACAGKHFERVHIQNGRPMPKKRKYVQGEETKGAKLLRFANGDADDATESVVVERERLEEEVRTALLQKESGMHLTPMVAEEDRAEWSMYERKWGKNNKLRPGRREREKKVYPFHFSRQVKNRDQREPPPLVEKKECAFCTGWSGVQQCPFHCRHERMMFVGDLAEGVAHLRDVQKAQREEQRKQWREWFYEGSNLEGS